MKKNKNVQQDPKKLRADEFTNVKDVKGSFLYTKNGFVIGYLHLHTYNLDLVPKEERRAKAKRLSAAFEADRKDFCYMSFFREIDLDGYKNDLKQKYRSTDKIKQRHILQEMLLEGTELSVNGENFEHQHFIKVWKEMGMDQKEAETEVKTRLEDFMQWYSEIGVQSQIMKDAEILKMCNLYGNSVQAPFDVIGNNMLYENMMKIL